MVEMKFVWSKFRAFMSKEFLTRRGLVTPALLSFFALVLAFGSCNSQNNTLIPREILFGNPERRAPRIAPDGSRIAYLAPDQNGVMNVWLKEKGKESLITSDQKRGIRFFFWGWDSNKIFYIQDLGGDENWHLYQTDLGTKETRDLTPFDGAQASVIAYEAQFPNQMLVQLNVRDPSLFDVYHLDLATGGLELIVENHDNVIEWLADHNLVVRASKSYDKKGGSFVSVRDSEKAPWREVLRWGPQEEGGLVSFSPDNRSLYLMSNIDANTERLLKMDLANGSYVVVAEDPQYDFGPVMKNPNSHELEAISVTRERVYWHVLSPSVEDDFSYLQKETEEMAVVSRDLKDRKWIVSFSSDRDPGRYYLYNRDTKAKEFLFSVQPKLKNAPLAEKKPIVFNARDGMKLYGYLTLPMNREPKNLPAVVYVHGGPWSRDTWGYDPYAQWLANRGYAVLQVNFRGSSGFGKNYLNAGDKEWAGKMHTDLLDGKNLLIEQGIFNPEKVAIFGGSYGGYATLVGLSFTPEEFCCGVDVVGPSNLITLSQTIPPYWAPFKAVWTQRVGNPETEQEFLKSRSPLFRAEKIVRPLLIGQGANDPRVKQSESDQIVSALREKGQQVEYILFPDEGHGFARPENRLRFSSVMEKFLHKHLGGKMEP